MKVKSLLIVLGILSIIAVPVLSESKSETDVIVLNKDNLIILDSVISPIVSSQVQEKLKSLGHGSVLRKKPKIYMFLRTPGGEVQSGLEIIEAISGSGRDVSTITSFAASMGFQLVQNLGERLIMSTGVLMSHRASGGIEGSFGGLRPSQLDSRYQLWLDRLNELDMKTVERTEGKQTLDSYQRAYASELWLTGPRAVELGYADRIVRVRCDDTLDGTETHTTDFMGMTISYDIPKCPLNSLPTNIRALTATGEEQKSKEPSEKTSKGSLSIEFTKWYNEKHSQVVPMTF